MAYWPTPPAATYWSRERRLTTATNATRCRLHPNHRPRNEEIIMSTDSNLPMDLYKANVQLWMHMGLLLQEVRQQWAELGDKRLRRYRGNPQGADRKSKRLNSSH